MPWASHCRTLVRVSGRLFRRKSLSQRKNVFTNWLRKLREKGDRSNLLQIDFHNLVACPPSSAPCQFGIFGLLEQVGSPTRTKRSKIQGLHPFLWPNAQAQKDGIQAFPQRLLGAGPQFLARENVLKSKVYNFNQIARFDSRSLVSGHPQSSLWFLNPQQNIGLHEQHVPG